MKIDLIIGSLQSGGAERVVSTLANYFSSLDNNVRIITFRNVDKYDIDHDVKRLRFHKNLPFFNYSLTRALVYLLSFYRKPQNRPDVISSHIDMMSAITVPIAKIYNIPIVISEHNNHLIKNNNFITKRFWNWIYKSADATTILTDYDIPYFEKYSRKLIVMPNPISFKPSGNQNLKREKSILSIGSLNRYHHKGFDNLIDIAKSISLFEPDWKFKIIGEGESGRQFLESKIEEAGLKDKVILLGYRSDVKKLLNKSSIYLLTSRYEGLPMSLIEAASQGIACIAYDCISGPSEIIENGKDGILIEDQNKDAMIESIKKLILDPKLRIVLGNRAIEKSEKFELERIGKKWIELFNSLLPK